MCYICENFDRVIEKAKAEGNPKKVAVMALLLDRHQANTCPESRARARPVVAWKDGLVWLVWAEGGTNG